MQKDILEELNSIHTGVGIYWSADLALAVRDCCNKVHNNKANDKEKEVYDECMNLFFRLSCDPDAFTSFGSYARFVTTMSPSFLGNDLDLEDYLYEL